MVGECAICRERLVETSWRCGLCQRATHHPCRGSWLDACPLCHRTGAQQAKWHMAAILAGVVALVAVAFLVCPVLGHIVLYVLASGGYYLLVLGYILGRKLYWEHLERSCPRCGILSRHHAVEVLSPDDGAMLGHDAEYTCFACQHRWDEGDGSGE